MEPKTPERVAKVLLCPNAPVRRVITLFEIKTSDSISDINLICEILKESNRDILGIKQILNLENLSLDNSKHLSIMTKMNISEIRDWIQEINTENIKFELVI